MLKTCKCGKQFNGRGNSIYCSFDCFKLYNSEIASTKFSTPPLTCKCCGKLFSRRHGQLNRQFCSQRCAKAWQKQFPTEAKIAYQNRGVSEEAKQRHREAGRRCDKKRYAELRRLVLTKLARVLNTRAC